MYVFFSYLFNIAHNNILIKGFLGTLHGFKILSKPFLWSHQVKFVHPVLSYSIGIIYSFPLATSAVVTCVEMLMLFLY